MVVFYLLLVYIQIYKEDLILNMVFMAKDKDKGRKASEQQGTETQEVLLKKGKDIDKQIAEMRKKNTRGYFNASGVSNATAVLEFNDDIVQEVAQEFEITTNIERTQDSKVQSVDKAIQFEIIHDDKTIRNLQHNLDQDLYNALCDKMNKAFNISDDDAKSDPQKGLRCFFEKNLNIVQYKVTSEDYAHVRQYIKDCVLYGTKELQERYHYTDAELDDILKMEDDELRHIERLGFHIEITEEYAIFLCSNCFDPKKSCLEYNQGIKHLNNSTGLSNKVSQINNAMVPCKIQFLHGDKEGLSNTIRAYVREIKSYGVVDSDNGSEMARFNRSLLHRNPKQFASVVEGIQFNDSLLKSRVKKKEDSQEKKGGVSQAQQKTEDNSGNNIKNQDLYPDYDVKFEAQTWTTDALQKLQKLIHPHTHAEGVSTEEFQKLFATKELTQNDIANLSLLQTLQLMTHLSKHQVEELKPAKPHQTRKVADSELEKQADDLVEKNLANFTLLSNSLAEKYNQHIQSQGEDVSKVITLLKGGASQEKYNAAIARMKSIVKGYNVVSAGEDNAIDKQLLADIILLIGAQTGKFLRPNQIHAVTEALKNPQTLAKLETGQGKTVVFQCSALYHALYAKKYGIARPVVILTHQEDLASSAAKEMQQICNIIGIKVSGASKAENQRYQADIMYHEVTSFSMQVARYQRFGKKSFDNPNGAPEDFCDMMKKMHQQGAILADEVDTFFDIDSSTTLRFATQNGEQNEKMPDLIRAINEAVDKAWKVSEQDRIGALMQKQEVIEVLKELGFKDAESQKAILSGAVKAKQMSYLENSDFVVLEDKTTFYQKDKQCFHAKKINIVAKNTTGVLDTQSKWSNGVHQFLTARVCDQKKLPPDAMPIPPFTSMIISTNIQKSLQHCNAKFIQGQTATPGSEAKRAAVASSAGMGKDFKYIEVQRAQKSQKYDVKSNVVDTQSEKFKVIADRLIRSHNDDVGNTLVIMKDIGECEALYAFLQDALQDDMKEHIKTFTGIDADKSDNLKSSEEAIDHLKQKGPKVLISTNVAGRGFDFTENLKNVVVGCMLSKEVMAQVAGRTGRQENYGVTTVVVTESECGLASMEKKPAKSFAELKAAREKSNKEISSLQNKMQTYSKIKHFINVIANIFGQDVFKDDPAIALRAEQQKLQDLNSTHSTKVKVLSRPITAEEDILKKQQDKIENNMLNKHLLAQAKAEIMDYAQNQWHGCKDDKKLSIERLLESVDHYLTTEIKEIAGQQTYDEVVEAGKGFISKMLPQQKSIIA